MASTQTFRIPQDEGELTPREAIAWQDAQLNEPNLAGDKDKAVKAYGLTQGIVSEWDERMQGLKRRWRGVYHMLSGNTLEKGGPEDVHVPEIYKAAETIVPRIEEQLLEREPWFKVVPRKKVMRSKAAAYEAFLDWEFAQAKVRDLMQPAARNMLFTQAAPFYCWWEVKKSMRNEREIIREYDKEGRMQRTVKVKKVEKIDFFGPKAKLVDPFDFIIDPKAMNPQDAIYVGHRVYMPIDEIRALGKQRGWKNIDKIENKSQGTMTASTSDFWTWPRDPASRYKTRADETMPTTDGRPQKLEVVFMYSKATFDDGETYDDYLITVVAGTTVVDLRVNPNDGQYRPYATARSGKSGHEFYSTGTFDNAVRLNQHLDAYEQTFLAGARLAGAPMGFAEDDSDLPDTLYRIRPGQILKGVGNIRFTQIPDGFLRAAPMVTGMIKKDIEETVGAFRINMGQDTGGTATEASLSLQEGNRRTRGLIRAMADGLEQLLHIFHKMNLQFSVEDIEFPVMGKRALSLRRDTVNMSPADIMDDIEFDLVGVRNTRNYGMKATGYQALLNGGMPLIMANAQSVDTLAMLHDLASELVGPEEADRYIKIPTPVDQLYSQESENAGLLNGSMIEVDPEDDDDEHMMGMQELLRRSLDPNSNMPKHVRACVLTHYAGHQSQRDDKQARKAVQGQRMQAQQQMAPPEAGGIAGQSGASPVAGGMSNALQQLAAPAGQSPGETPGPTSPGQQPRPGGRNMTLSQSDNAQ